MFTLKKQIPANEVSPKYYGFAYYLDYKNIAVYYPVPINIFVYWKRKLWHWLAHIPVTQGVFKDRYWSGYADGFRDGHDSGSFNREVFHKGFPDK